MYYRVEHLNEEDSRWRITADPIIALRQYDTPTICNALELTDSLRHHYGYTKHNMVTVNQNQSPIVGIAYTATMRSMYPAPIQGDEMKTERMKYYEYMFTDENIPKICVMQDLDGVDAGHGPFFGEFNTRVHRAMGFNAIITDGTVRDVPNLPDDVFILCGGFRPSHGFVHVVSWGGQVNVSGMTVSPGDVVHADIHGAVAFPASWAERVAENAERFVASETPIMQACKTDRLTLEKLRRLYLSR